MIPFLKEVTTEMFVNHSDGFNNVAVVFPNKRASLYFKKYITEIVDKPIFLPEIFTVDEIISKFSNLVDIDDISLTYYLFQSFKKFIKTTENFDDFYFWGQMLLSDFDDIDKELVNAKDIFSNLAEQKEIDLLFSTLTPEQVEAVEMFWGAFKAKNESEHKKKFLEIWNQLYSIYTDFNSKLREEGKSYKGMMYRDAHSNFTSEKLAGLDFDKIYFIGFNALNKVERNFFTFVEEEGVAAFYWDYDNYFLGDKKHEAGFFLKDNIENFPQKSKIEHNYLTKTQKTVEFISTPSAIGQAKLVSTLLSEFEELPDYDINKTAIILADETLLLPVLHSLPKGIEKLNITMGFPLKETPAFNLIISLVELQIQKNSNSNFYYKNVKSILTHPYITGLYTEYSKHVLNNIAVDNIIYIESKIFEENDFFRKIFTPITQTENIQEYLVNILDVVYQHIEDENSEGKLSLEYISTLSLAINKVNELLLSSEIEVGVKTYFSIIKTVLSGKSIPFEGEPIGGLQVMGILETRLLDFENIIFLSMNEGILPKTGATNSFISYNLRKGFGIPTIEHQDSIYGYYFYRLLQRANNIRLVYNSSVSISSKEKSRFLSQIKFENLFDVKERNFTFKTDVPITQEISIKKTSELLQKLDSYTRENNPRSLSPSAINTYIDCSLKFYFRYVEGIKPADEVTEEIDYAIFGSILHKAIQVLYSKFEETQVEIQRDDLVAISGNIEIIEDAIVLAFSEEYFNNRPIKKADLYGRNIIIFDIILKYVKAIIEKDIEYCPFKILKLEKPFSFSIDFEIDNKKQQIITGGIIDRVDEKNGVVRILDYKTGSTDTDFKSVEQLINKDIDKRPKAVLQTFVYAEAFKNENPSFEIIEPGIIKVKEILSGNYDIAIRFNKVPVNNYLQFRDEFKQEIKTVVSEIFNIEKAFCQTNNDKKCAYCDYSNICHR